MKDTFKNVLSFEFWQNSVKALMVVIAVMPAAGLMISIGKSLAMIDPNLAPLVITGGVLEQIGWGVIVNLHILFALAIGGSWAKETRWWCVCGRSCLYPNQSYHWYNLWCIRRYVEKSRSYGNNTLWWINQGC